MLCRREISLFLYNNQSMLYKSFIHSSRASHEIIDSLPVHVDGRKEHALYHSNDSIIQSQSQNHLFILSPSPDSEANTPSSPILFNPPLYSFTHSYPFPTEQKQPKTALSFRHTAIPRPLPQFVFYPFRTHTPSNPVSH